MDDVVDSVSRSQVENEELKKRVITLEKKIMLSIND